MVQLLAPNREPVANRFGSLAVGTRGAARLRYNRIGPQLNPPMAVRDAGGRYGASKRPVGPEAILHVAWRNAGLERASLRGRDGHSYRVVYGGKPGGSLGPDFTDAVVERDDGVTFRGDIEIHVRESDWRAHGHHNDRRYNGVVLHVVAAESAGRPTLRATGTSIPLLVLNWTGRATRDGAGFRGSDATGPQHGGTPHGHPKTSEAPMGFSGPMGVLDLAAAGLERFHAQAAGLALDIEAFGPDQAVWLGVMGALGYPRNKRAFRMLATRVPWSMATACGGSKALGSLLTRAAGLGADPVDSWVTATGISGLPGRPPEWVRPWGRPANSPAARIGAISVLVSTWSGGHGIAETWMRHVTEVAGTKDHRTLSAIFRPRDLVENPAITVMGAARAAEIVVNVLLPAVFALATGDGRDGVGLKNRALALYIAHPKLAENSVTREAKVALGVDYQVPEITSARDQQGLITLYREMLRTGIRPRQGRLPGV